MSIKKETASIALETSSIKIPVVDTRIIRFRKRAGYDTHEYKDFVINGTPPPLVNS